MMEKKLKSMDGIVRNALYVSKEDAQKLMMKHVGEDAFEILKKLNNSKHYLISSVCISQNGAMLWNHSDSSELKMKNLTDNLILKYLSTIQILIFSLVVCPTYLCFTSNDI